MQQTALPGWPNTSLRAFRFWSRWMIAVPLSATLLSRSGGPGTVTAIRSSTSVFVRKDQRSGGIGTTLMVELIDRARTLGKHVMAAGIEASN
jgi:GNAT superfamily N-acetyltransferase